jgi:hypothetical protein
VPEICSEKIKGPKLGKVNPCFGPDVRECEEFTISRTVYIGGAKLAGLEAAEIPKWNL